MSDSIVRKEQVSWVREEALPFFAALLIALTPACFALATWREVYVSNQFRVYAVPVLVTEILVFILSVTWMASARRWEVKPSLAVACALGALAVLSVINAKLAAVQPGPAGLRAATTIIHCLFALGIFYLAVTSDSFSKWVPRALAVGLNLFQLICFLLLFTHPDLQQLDLSKVGAGVTNVRQLGFYGSIGTALSLGLSLFAKSRREAFFWMFSALISLTFILWSGTRGGLFALSGMVLVSTVLLPAPQFALCLFKRLAILSPPAAVLSLLWVPHDPRWGFERILGTFVGTTENQQIDAGRARLWAETIDIIGSRPLTGYGEGQFRFLAESARGYFAHPHNFMLQFLVNWGIIGFCLAMFAILAGFTRARTAARASDPVATPALLAATTLLIYGLIDGTLYHIYPLSTFIALLVVASARPRFVEAP